MDTLDKDFSTLISIIDDIASIYDFKALIARIFLKIHELYDIQMVGVGVLDKKKENIVIIIAEIDEIKFPEPLIWHKKISIADLTKKAYINTDKLIEIRVDEFNDFEKFNDSQISLKEIFTKRNIRSLSFLPTRTGGELVGYLVITTSESGHEKNIIEYTQKIASLIGSVMKRAMDFTEIQEKEKEKEILLSLISNLVEIKQENQLYEKLAEVINEHISFDYFVIYVTQKDFKFFRSFSLIKDDTGKFGPISHPKNIINSITTSLSNLFDENKGGYIEIKGEYLEKLCKQYPYVKQLKENKSINSFVVMQYGFKNKGELNLILGRKKRIDIKDIHSEKMELLFSEDKDAFFSEKEIEFGIHLLPHLGLILANLYAFEEIQNLTKKLEQEKNFLLDEINLSSNFQEIIGNSEKLNKALNKVQQVAPLDATVLILGETGTGKELIAKAVHNLSKRKENAFITVNCAALPAQLIESELFGHEKGSFTGAIERRIGKFEIANNGTIFLDEIGELPLETQAKLLRVLQEKEFERLGGKSTIFSDVRIVAATNRNLEKEVENGKFRADLFFRLNVFPILVPPLKERTEDIPLLIKHFINKYSKKIGKEIKSINKNDLDSFIKYNWPGNIRELEHLIERAMIISEGANLNFEKLLTSEIVKPELDTHSFKTLVEIEKEHIVEALKIAKGKITGDNSAANLLGMNGKTLGSRMKKLGLKKEIIYYK